MRLAVGDGDGGAVGVVEGLCGPGLMRMEASWASKEPSWELLL